MNDGIIIGRNSVLEAIKTGRNIEKIMIKPGAPEGSLIKLVSAAKSAGIPVAETDKRKLDKMAEGGNHQGVVAMASVYEYVNVEDILNASQAKGEQPFVVICDKITDPHNLGSIIRSAVGAGAHGIIISKHESVGVNATVSKVSVGAVENLPIARVTNLAKTIDFLKDAGLWVYGTSGDGDKTIHETDFGGPVAIVIGSEGSGMSRLVREKCDFLVKIPMIGPLESLNASVAAALVMYEVTRKRLG